MRKTRVKYAVPATVWLFSLCFPCIQSRLVAEDWLQYGGPNRNFQTSNSLSTAGKTKHKGWKKSLECGDSGLVATEDRLIVVTRDISPDGTDAHRIVCVQRASGDLIWESSFQENSFTSQDINDRYPVRPIATPCVVGDSVVVCGYGGSVRCVDLSSGRLRWEVDLVKKYGALPIQYGFSGSPLSDGNQVIVPCGGDQALLLSLSVNDGSLQWKSSNGMASYTSPMFVEMPTGANGATEKQILYAGGDAVIGVQPNDGKILWRYQYEKQGLTNAVTPLVIEPGKILLGGQGVQGCLLLDVRREQTEYRTEVVWENSKVQPFYCNWVQTRTKPNCILGFAGKTLTAIEATTGKVLWQKRGWTDANVISTPDALVIVRGDGVAAIGDVDETGIRIRKANAGTQDRVWAAPVIVNGMMYLAGRNSLSCVPIEEFAETDSIPDGSAVTSMDAMYGNKPESIQKLIDQSKDATQFTKMEYQETVSNSVVQLGESDYGAILENLEKQSAWPLAIEIATDWSERNPQSIVAFERLVGLLRRVGQIDQAESLVQARMVDVTIIARIPKSATAPEHIYLSGNAAALGPWQAEGVELTKIGVDMVQVKLQLPKGDFQYKFTCGTWDNVESRADGRSISNRRIRIAGPMTIQAEIQAWKDSARESK